MSSKTGDVRRLGRYELLRPLGAGGMAQVWLAQLRAEDGLSKTVAVKLLAPGLAADPKYQAMFRAEMRMSMWLSHSNIVQVFDCGVEQGQAYIVMEWVDGVTLADLLDSCRESAVEIPLAVIVRVSSCLLKALAYAHELRHEGEHLGLVHRDISPQNVLLSVSGEMKLTDFGIARVMSEDTTSTQPKGKLRYMAPEQLRGEGIDGRTDLYAVGALLHEMLSGEKFRHGTNNDDLFRQAWMGTIPSLNRKAPAAIDALRRSLLSLDKAGRPIDAAAALRKLSLPSQPPSDPELWLADAVRGLVGVGAPRSGIEVSAGADGKTPISRSERTQTTLPAKVPISGAEFSASRPPDSPPGQTLKHWRPSPIRSHQTEPLNEISVEGGREIELPRIASNSPAHNEPPRVAPEGPSGARAEQASPDSAAFDVEIDGDEGEWPRRSNWPVFAAVGGGIAAVALLAVWNLKTVSIGSGELEPALPASSSLIGESSTALEPESTLIASLSTLAEIDDQTSTTESKTSEGSFEMSTSNGEPSRPVVDPPKPTSGKVVRPSVNVVFKADELRFTYLRIGRKAGVAEPNLEWTLPIGKHVVYWRRDTKEAWKPAGTLNLRKDASVVVHFSADGSMRVSPLVVH
jgi:serine/threonine protein kinase